MPRARTLCTLALVASTALACRRDEPPPVAMSPAAESSEDADAAQAEETTPTAAPPPAAIDPNAWPPPLFEVVRGRVAVGLAAFETDDGALFVTAGPQVMPLTDGIALDTSPRWLVGIETDDPRAMRTYSGWEVRALGGRNPETFFMTLWEAGPGREAGYPFQAYRWTGERWRETDGRTETYFSNPARLEAWGEDTVLSMRTFDPRTDYGPTPQSEADRRQRDLDERRARAMIATAKPLVIIAGPGRAPQVERFTDFDAHPSGTLMLLRGDEVEHRERHGSTVHRTLPEAEGLGEGRIMLEAPDRAYVFGSLESSDTDDLEPYLAHWDGHTWTRQATPPCSDALVALSWSSRQGTWVICRKEWSSLGVRHPGTVFGRRTEDGPWTPLPRVGSDARFVVASERHGLWVVTPQLVYGPTEPEAVFEAPPLDVVANTILEYGDPRSSFDCEGAPTRDAYALLEGDEHPALAELLRTLEDFELVEVEFRGSPRAAVHFEDGDIDPVVREQVRTAIGDALEGVHCLGRSPLP